MSASRTRDADGDEAPSWDTHVSAGDLGGFDASGNFVSSPGPTPRQPQSAPASTGVKPRFFAAGQDTSLEPIGEFEDSPRSASPGTLGCVTEIAVRTGNPVYLLCNSSSGDTGRQHACVE